MWAAYPRARADSTNRWTARPSWPDGLYSTRSARSTSVSSMGERPPEGIDREGPLVLGDHERRQEPDDGRAPSDREDALVLKGLEDRGRLPPELDPDHQPEPPHLAHIRRPEGAEVVDRGRAQPLRPLRQALPRGDVDRGSPRGTREGVPAEGGVVAPLERPLDRLRRQGRADRDAPRQGLREGQDVGLDAPPLDREHPARPPHPRLDLVEDQEGPGPVADLPRGGQVLRRGDVDPSLPLDGLEDHRGGAAVHGFPEGLDIIVRHVLEPGYEGLEGLPELPPPGRAQRAHRAAVEPPHRSDDLRPPGGRARELDRGLDGLGARV